MPKGKKSPLPQPKHLFPPLGTTEHQTACNEIASQLAKNWNFKLQVVGTIILLALAVAAVLGWNLFSQLKASRTEFESKVKTELEAAKAAFEDQIKKDLRTENVQAIIQGAAASEGRQLLAKNIEPSITKFQVTIDSMKNDVTRKFTDFNILLKESGDSAEGSLQELRHELTRLKQRNNLTALADKAISGGDVDAYRTLESLTSATVTLDHSAAKAELHRIYSSYSPLSPASSYGTKIQADKINPSKHDENELDIEELLPLLKMEDPLGRAKVAQLIIVKAKPKSLLVANALHDALAKETHLEAIRFLKIAFSHVCGYHEPGRLDQEDCLKWWDKNKYVVKWESEPAVK